LWRSMDLITLALAFLAYITLVGYNHWWDWRDLETFIERTEL